MFTERPLRAWPGAALGAGQDCPVGGQLPALRLSENAWERCSPSPTLWRLHAGQGTLLGPQGAYLVRLVTPSGSRILLIFKGTHDSLPVRMKIRKHKPSPWSSPWNTTGAQKYTNIFFYCLSVTVKKIAFRRVLVRKEEKKKKTKNQKYPKLWEKEETQTAQIHLF